MQRPDGTARDCLVMAALPTDAEGFSRLLVSVFDVTDYKADQARLIRAEREVARASRLLTVGVLTGSITHEVNNPLAAAITSAEAALRWLGRREPDLGEAVAAIEGGITAAMRAQDVVDRTRRLVTRGRLDTQALDATATLGAAFAVMARELNDGWVIVSMTVRPGLPRMQADPVQVQQVLVNLLQNALRAMRAVGERLVTLEASPHADGVCVRVGDNGIGIPLSDLIGSVAALTAAMVLARFVWIVPSTYVVRFLFPSLRRRDPYPPFAMPMVMGWARMRGVVSLAVALSLPAGFPGRDLLLPITLAVVLVSILLQGTMLGPLTRAPRLRGFALETPSTLDEAAARAHLAQAALDAVRAARSGLLALHRAARVDDEVLRLLEAELDLEELGARHALGGRA